MKRSVIYSEYNEDKIKVKVRLEQFPSIQKDKFAQYNLLSTIVDSPNLINCAVEPFEKMSMFHDGEKWVMELEALVDRSKLGDVSVPHKDKTNST